MKSAIEKARLAGFVYDLRVRPRHIAAGTLDPKAVERYLAELPDLEAHAETIPFEQPALGNSGNE